MTGDRIRLRNPALPGGQLTRLTPCADVTRHPTVAAFNRCAAARGSGCACAVDDVVQRGGEPLGSATRAVMEQALGADLGALRIHADARAARSAEGLRARAWASGEHIAFGAGMYEPGSPQVRTC